NLADSTIKQYACKLERELDRLLELEPTNAEGRHLRDAIIVDARDKLLVFMRHRDVEPTNNGSEQKLRPSVIFRKVTNCFRSEWGAKLYADLCSIVSTGRPARPEPSRRNPQCSDGPLRACYPLITGTDGRIITSASRTAPAHYCAALDVVGPGLLSKIMRDSGRGLDDLSFYFPPNSSPATLTPKMNRASFDDP